MSNTKEKLNIICFSNQLWDFPNWTNKRHVMSRMAKLGHNVLFVDPPINTGFVFYRQIQRGLWPVKRIFSQLKKDPTGALVYTPLNLITQTDITSKLHAKRIRNLARKRFSNDHKTVVWIYHMEIPGLENYLEILNYDLLVYDCVDHYEAFPQYDTKEKKSVVRAREKYLAEKADLIFASAPGLVDKLRSYNKNVHFTPNVGDYEKFKNSSKLADQLPEDLASIKETADRFYGGFGRV
jgi:poly-D-alanine transfer protein DltD